MFRLNGYLNLRQIEQAIKSVMQEQGDAILGVDDGHSLTRYNVWVDDAIFSVISQIDEVYLYLPGEPLAKINLDFLAIDETGKPSSFYELPDLENDGVQRILDYHMAMWKAFSPIHPVLGTVFIPPTGLPELDGHHRALIERYSGFGVLAREESVTAAVKEHSRWLNENTHDTCIQRPVGRPSLQGKARAAYELAFPSGHGRVHWTEVENRVEKIAGQKIDRRTIRRAILNIEGKK